MIHKPGFKARWKGTPDILLIAAGVCEKQSGFSLCRKDSSSSGSSPSLRSNNKDNITREIFSLVIIMNKHINTMTASKMSASRVSFLNRPGCFALLGKLKTGR